MATAQTPATRTFPVPIGRPRHGRLAQTALEPTFVLRLGLAALFVVNAFVALVNPEEFTGLVERAGFDRLIDPQVVVWGIRVNDAAVAAALLLAWNRWPRLVSLWAGGYLFGVAVIKAAALV